MKKFLKIFFIFLYLLFSLGTNDGQASYVIKNFSEPVVQKAVNDNNIILNFDVAEDTSIAASNSSDPEIVGLKNKNSNNSALSHNSVSSALIRNFVKRYYVNILSRNSLLAFQILKDVICVRAP